MTRLQLRFKERRNVIRLNLTGLLPGRLRTRDTKHDVNGTPVDVSRTGLGILTSHELKVGDQLEIVFKDTPIHLRVSWTKPDFGKQNLTRVGLETEDDNVDLEDVFLQSGCATR